MSQSAGAGLSSTHFHNMCIGLPHVPACVALQHVYHDHDMIMAFVSLAALPRGLNICVAVRRGCSSACLLTFCSPGLALLALPVPTYGPTA